jgi:hypothetical protein
VVRRENSRMSAVSGIMAFAATAIVRDQASKCPPPSKSSLRVAMMLQIFAPPFSLRSEPRLPAERLGKGKLVDDRNIRSSGRALQGHKQTEVDQEGAQSVLLRRLSLPDFGRPLNDLA